MKILGELAESFHRRNIVLFVGAGLSIGAGLPGWGALIHPLAQAVGARWPANEADLATDHLLSAAQHYENQRGRNALIRHLRDALDPTGIQPTLVHRLIASLPVHVIFTTNYDDFVERALREAGQRLNVIIDESELTYWSEEHVQVVKLCGDLQRPESIVLTKHDFNTYFVTRPRLAERLRTTLESKTALFLGYSLQDPFLNQIWDNIGLDFGRHRRMGYAVLFDVTPLEADDLRQRGIHVIHLETHDRDKSVLFEEWLKRVIGESVSMSSDEIPFAVSGMAPSSKDPATFVPFIIRSSCIDLVDANALLDAAKSPQRGHQLVRWLSLEDPDKTSAMIEQIGPQLLVSLSDSPQDVHNLLLDLEAQSPPIGKLLASKTSPQFAAKMSKSPRDWEETQLILQRLQAEAKGECVYDFFERFEEADLSDLRKPHCSIYPDESLVSGGVAKPGIFQHPPLPEYGPCRLPYPPIPIPGHIQGLRLDFFIGILDKRLDTGEQQVRFSKDPLEGDAVKFRVRINGRGMLDKRLNSVGWVPYSLPIELPTDGELTVEFIIDAMSNATANWAAWGKPRLVGIRAVEKEVAATIAPKLVQKSTPPPNAVG